jgi:hypothetical protein
MSESTGLCLRALRICALACLPLLGACAGQFAGSTHSPPRVDVPEPGNGRTAPVTRAPATAQPQPSAQRGKGLSCDSCIDCSPSAGLSGCATAARGAGVAFRVSGRAGSGIDDAASGR